MNDCEEAMPVDKALEPKKIEPAVQLVEFKVKVNEEIITVSAEDVIESTSDRHPYVLSRFNNDNDFLRAILVAQINQNKN